MCIDNQVSMLNHLNSICYNNVHTLCIDKYIMDFENNAQFIFQNTVCSHQLYNSFPSSCCKLIQVLIDFDNIRCKCWLEFEACTYFSCNLMI